MIDNEDVVLHKTYWVVNTAFPPEKALYQTSFDYRDELLEMWELACFDNEVEAAEFLSTIKG